MTYLDRVAMLIISNPDGLLLAALQSIMVLIAVWLAVCFGAAALGIYQELLWDSLEWVQRLERFISARMKSRPPHREKMYPKLQNPPTMPYRMEITTYDQDA